MNQHTTNKLKISGELITMLARNKYAYYDKAGQIILRLTALQHDETIQSVAAWFRDKSTADLLLGELRQQLEMNGLPPLRDHSETAIDAKRAYGFKEFGKKLNISFLIFSVFLISGCSTTIDRADDEQKEFNACMDWAFGEDSTFEPRNQMDELWNKRHGDIFKLKGTDDYYASVNRIQRACRERGVK